jgi:hypothetical protein
MFYFVQKEQPCPSRLGEMDEARIQQTRVMSISSTKKTMIFEVPNKLKSQSFESIVKPSEHRQFPQLWNRLTMQRIVMSVCGPLDEKQPIYSEIRIGLRILTAGDEARRIFLGPDSFLQFECYLP